MLASKPRGPRRWYLYRAPSPLKRQPHRLHQESTQQHPSFSQVRLDSSRQGSFRIALIIPPATHSDLRSLVEAFPTPPTTLPEIEVLTVGCVPRPPSCQVASSLIPSRFSRPRTRGAVREGEGWDFEVCLEAETGSPRAQGKMRPLEPLRSLRLAEQHLKPCPLRGRSFDAKRKRDMRSLWEYLSITKWKEGALPKPLGFISGCFGGGASGASLVRLVSASKRQP